VRAAGLWLVLLVGCGPDAGAWVTIDAPLSVPDQCDSVRVSATAGAKTLFEAQRAIGVGQQFPQTIALYASGQGDVGQPITLEVTALRGGQPSTSWSTASASVTLEHGKLVPVTVEIAKP
jgi:hypothetical protein